MCPGIDKKLLLAAHVCDKIYADISAVNPQTAGDAMNKYFASQLTTKLLSYQQQTDLELVLILLHSCEVDNEANLPELHQKVRHAQKVQRRNVVIRCLQQTRCTRPKGEQPRTADNHYGRPPSPAGPN
jgi:hypothetical protein